MSLILYQITQGRCEYREQALGPVRLGAAGQVHLPPDLQPEPSYEGQLFRVLHEVRGGEGQPQRVWVSATGQTRLQQQPDGYVRLGFTRNPFVLEVFPERCEDWQGVAGAHWLERGHTAPPPSTGTLVQLLGVKGAGKSSHLMRWRSTHAGPYMYFPPEYLGRWQVPPVAPICYWDEACRIPAPLLGPALMRAARQRATVCVGTHRDLSGAARLAGLEVRTIRFGPLSGAEVLAWAERHMAAARLAGTEQRLQLTEAHAQAVAEASGGSWREVGAALHVWAAKSAAEALVSE